jgi:hypothetical protein
MSLELTEKDLKFARRKVGLYAKKFARGWDEDDVEQEAMLILVRAHQKWLASDRKWDWEQWRAYHMRYGLLNAAQASRISRGHKGKAEQAFRFVERELGRRRLQDPSVTRRDVLEFFDIDPEWYDQILVDCFPQEDNPQLSVGGANEGRFLLDTLPDPATQDQESSLEGYRRLWREFKDTLKDEERDLCEQIEAGRTYREIAARETRSHQAVELQFKKIQARFQFQQGLLPSCLVHRFRPVRSLSFQFCVSCLNTIYSLKKRLKPEFYPGGDAKFLLELDPALLNDFPSSRKLRELQQQALLIYGKLGGEE